MPRKRPSIGVRQLGELDVDILLVIWRMKKATVKDVFEVLYDTRRLAYTTIMTVMGRLAKKGILSQDRSRTPYEYTPLVRREELAASIVSHVVNRLLEGDYEILINVVKAQQQEQKKEQPTAEVPALV